MFFLQWFCLDGTSNVADVCVKLCNSHILTHMEEADLRLTPQGRVTGMQENKFTAP